MEHTRPPFINVRSVALRTVGVPCISSLQGGFNVEGVWSNCVSIQRKNIPEHRDKVLVRIDESRYLIAEVYVGLVVREC